MVSIIIVNYHVKEDLLSCIESIYASRPKTEFEIIVVDNDEKKTLAKELKKQFPKVRYIKNENMGFGQGNNTGAKNAKGEYLFILNPDTKFLNNSLDALVSFLKKNKSAGIAAPILFDKENKPFSLQGTKELTPSRAIFALSFIGKLFPRNRIYQDYYLGNWNKKTNKEIAVIPGTAFVIRKEIFEKLGGFDEKFFLFFEEFDLCKRVKQLGWKMFMVANAHIFHAWGSSTKKSKKDVNTIFKKSRFYYFKKHFGLLQALCVEGVLRINKYAILLILFITLGLNLRLFNINQTLQFIGDQGWYYLSARDIVLTGKIPLVGIASSHPWLHQGALWTYLLVPTLWLFNFNPVSGAYLSIMIGVLGILGIYRLGSEMFSKNVGLIAAALFATSPLIVFSDQMAYHTSPIPLFIIGALYCLHKWIRGNKYYFPLLITSLAVLYNFEIATFLFGIMVFVFWLYGLFAKKEWAKATVNIKVILWALAGWLIVMLPMMLYDLTHGFPQTLKVLAWVGYRILVFLGYSPINPITHVSFNEMVDFVSRSYQDMIFSSNGFLAFTVFAASIFYLLSQIIKRSDKSAFILLGTVNLFLLLGLFVAKTPSGAYIPMVFPGVMLLMAVLFNGLIDNKVKVISLFGLIGIVCVVSVNSLYIFQKSSADTFFLQRLEAARQIVKDAEKKEYNLIGTGVGSKFESFTKNYEYLLWWLGNGPSKTEQELRFVISEENYAIQVKKEEVKIKNHD